MIRARAAGVQSLRWRLLALTLAGMAVALVLAAVVLSGLFREQVQQQFQAALAQQLDQVTARLEFDAQGRPQVAAEALSDPRWTKPYSGLYWQVDQVEQAGPGGGDRAGVLRSRSLWDTSLALEADPLPDGAVHVHEVAGPQGAPLLVLERGVREAAGGSPSWRLIVAADLQPTQAASDRFTRLLLASLAVLFALLAAAAWAQVAIGLRPLAVLQRSLQAVRQARAARLEGAFPAEVQPLVDDFNAVLGRNADVVDRARTQAGNLAHALKTPLTVLEQAARAPAGGGSRVDLPALVHEQVQVARRHIDWHLARARLAATAGLPGQRTELGPVLHGLVRVMRKVHAARQITIQIDLPDAALWFAGEEQDLQEMLGNLLDNACKWARSVVRVQAQWMPQMGPGGAKPHRGQLLVRVSDDGPGLAGAQRAQALQRGVRLDEAVPGTGLGLAIVQELAGLYGGRLELEGAGGSGTGAGALQGLVGLHALLLLPAA